MLHLQNYLGRILFIIFICSGLHSGAQISKKDKNTINKYLKEASLNDEQGEDAADAFFEVGFIYSTNKMYATAKKNYEKAIKATESNRKKITYYNSIGNDFDRQKNVRKTIEYFNKALTFAKKTTESKQKKLVPGAYNAIGYVYESNGQCEKAIANYKEYLKFAIKIKSRSHVKKVIDKIAKCYKKLKDPEEAERYSNMKNDDFEIINENVFEEEKPPDNPKDQKNTKDTKPPKQTEIEVLARKLGIKDLEISSGKEMINELNTLLENVENTLIENSKKLDIIKKELKETQAELSITGKILKNQKLALTISIVVILIILTLVIFIYTGYRNKIKQNILLDIQKNEIELQAVSISQKNEELNATLNNLRSTQTQLIQSEKMASLGQLIAGIAHELNTPLGAIKSSISTVADTSKLSLELLPKLISSITKHKFNIFMRLINRSTENNIYLTSREERKIRRSLKKELNSLNIENADDIAYNLVDIRVYENYSEFVPLFKDKNAELIINTAYNLSQLLKNSDNIKMAVSRSSKIIYALKSYSHTGHEKMISTSLVDNINTVLTIYQNKLGHDIIVKKSFTEVPEIICNPDKLNQVWTNIIHNSIQAMDGKGVLTIKIGVNVDSVIVSFKDTGKGIPEDIRERIFEPFFTTKPAGEGTGLGLDIISKIIENHNGKITFDSEIGKGTTFYVELPMNLINN